MAATVTATPPARADVKPLSPIQARERQIECEARARTHHVTPTHQRTFIANCLRQIILANDHN